MKKGLLQIIIIIAVISIVSFVCLNNRSLKNTKNHLGFVEKNSLNNKVNLFNNNSNVAIYDKEELLDGYTLFSPIYSNIVYLIDNSGKIVHTWNTEYSRNLLNELLENGNILRTSLVKQELPTYFKETLGKQGVIQEIDWKGNVVWDYIYASDEYLAHHGFEKLPNGNVLIIAWQYKTYDEAIKAERSQKLMDRNWLLPDTIIEVKPTSKSTGEIVWQWNLWDHLIQDNDPTKNNYGEVKEHPELIDINYVAPNIIENLSSLEPVLADFSHINTVGYNEELDQIILSVRNFNEFWIIDHSTSTVEAATHSGGKYGKGGDLLYRWGNPAAYNKGLTSEQKLFAQHDANWIPKGYLGQGNILLFNNGVGRPEGEYSSSDEIELPINSNGLYDLQNKPDQALWRFEKTDHEVLYSKIISGTQRLPNGNTLITSGVTGIIYEVTPDKKIVWEYHNKINGNTPPSTSLLKPTSIFNARKYKTDYPGLKQLTDE